MWKVVLWLNVKDWTLLSQVWSLYAAGASHHEPYYEYLYVRRDGVALMEPLTIPIYRNDTANKTTYLINNNPKLMDQDTIQALRRRVQRRRWTGIAQSISAIRAYRHRLGGPMGHAGFKKDKQLVLLQKALKYDEESQCVDGPTKFMDCNHCVCMGGQLYICTSKKCARDKKIEKIRGLKHRVFAKESSCIEGEQIRSFDGCNHCYCGGGQVLCTKKQCLEGEQNLIRRECISGKRLPSPDGCNTCTCNTRGIIVCTTNACGPVISKHIKDQVCVPNTWYSPRGSSRCKECYCINGKISFCFMNLCTRKSKNYSAQKFLLPGSLPDTCEMKDYIQDKCTRCDCGTDGVWLCQTKEIHKTCTDAVPEKLKIANHLRKRLKNKHRLLTSYSRFPIYSTKFTFDMSTYFDEKPGDEWYKTTHKSKHRQPSKSTTTTIQDFDRTTGLELDDYTRSSGNEQEVPKLSLPKKYKISFSPNFESHEGLDYFEDQSELDEILEELDDYVKGIYTEPPPTKWNEPDSPGKSTRLDNNFPDNLESAAESELETNVDKGPYCVTGQFFTVGSDHTCHGCFCTPNNEWKCWSMKNACRASAPCNAGRMKKNPEAPCSVCYCGADKKSYCATDESCSYSIKPSNCEAIACLNYCTTTNYANFGVCHQDQCVCVQNEYITY